MREAMKPTQIAVSKACAACPFRWDVRPYIRASRVVEIMDAAAQGQHLVCHKTVDYCDFAAVCAALLTLLDDHA